MRRACLGLLLTCACAPSVQAPAAPAPTSEQPGEPDEVEDPEPAEPSTAPTIAGADPSINEPWASDDVDPLVARLESETREVYVHRAAIVEAVAPQRGMAIADIGAGSGFMSMEFAKAVGNDGSLVAVDVNATMLERLAKAASEAGMKQLRTSLSTQEGPKLDPASLDLVFICDTYHHFEQPGNTLAALHEALKPGGQLILVDFDRVEGESEQWLLDHVRAGKEVFRAEVEAAGFTFVREHDLPQLEQNYVLRFEKGA